MTQIIRQRPYAYQESVAAGALAPGFPLVRAVRVIAADAPAEIPAIEGLSVEDAATGGSLQAWILRGNDEAFRQVLEGSGELPKDWREAVRDALFPPRKRWVTAAGRDLLQRDGPLVMGILNTTPDSFSDGGQFIDPDKAVEQALELQKNGANILDVGGESTRPGADPVSAEDELNRVMPVLEALSKLPPAKFRIPVSIDTRKAEVADKALQAGAVILNDVQGLRDEAMIEVAKKHRPAVVMMHMRGEPGNMTQQARYDHVVDQVLMELLGQRDRAVTAGIKAEQILLDPGIGFAKTGGQSWQLLRHLPAFLPAGHGLMVGASRKRLLEELLSLPVSKRDRPSATLHALSVARGADVLRVHDPTALVEALTVAQAMGFGSPE